MNVLRKCCYRTMKENRRRTVAMILGVMLATALITGTACLLSSWRSSMAESARRENGDWHYAFFRMKSDKLRYISENRNVAEYGVVKHLGWVQETNRYNTRYIQVSAADDRILSSLGLCLTEGRLPETDGEIIVGEYFLDDAKYALGQRLYIGDSITLPVGNRMLGDQVLADDLSFQEGERLEIDEEKTYTIVGTVEYIQVGKMSVADHMVITRSVGDKMPETVDVYAKYTDWGLDHQAQVTAGILGVSEELFRKEAESCTPEELAELTKTAKRVSRNDDFLFWKRLDIFDEYVFELLVALCSLTAVGFYFIMLASAFCIRASFEISLADKMKLCGRLASVGTTKRQMRKIVYYEAGALSAAGIPLGVLMGHLGCWILVKALGNYLEETRNFRMYFATSPGAVLFAAALSLATVYYSAGRSVRKASRISPMEAIRQNEAIKIGRKGMKCPGWVKKCFGVGGSIAYKNRRRAKAKYLPTVISIAVSVAMFIGIGAFMAVRTQIREKYQKEESDLVIYMYGEDAYENAKMIMRMEGVEEYHAQRFGSLMLKAYQIPYTERGKRHAFIFHEEDLEEDKSLYLYSMDEASYQKYCKEIGADPEQAKDKAIVLAYLVEEESDEKGETVSVKKDLMQYHPGDVIMGKPGAVMYNRELSWEERIEKLEELEPLSLEVYCQTNEAPGWWKHRDSGSTLVIVSEEWMDRHAVEIGAGAMGATVDMNFKRLTTADILEEKIQELNLDCGINNYAAQYRSDTAPYTVASSIFYLLAAVITLIGVTNIFNTVTTNMEQRASEFAMLRSVGMTEKEFRRMIWLEGFFWGGQALLFGFPFGMAISWMIQMTAWMFIHPAGQGLTPKFHFPFLGILIAAAAVFALLFGIMRYSMNRINRRNIIETIRSENI